MASIGVGFAIGIQYVSTWNIGAIVAEPPIGINAKPWTKHVPRGTWWKIIGKYIAASPMNIPNYSAL